MASALLPKVFRKNQAGILALICAVILAACSDHQPAPIQEYSASGVKRELSSDGSYHVRTGDTLYAIAFNFDVDTRDVARWNDISSPYIIYPGQKLVLKAPPTYSRNGGSSSEVQISTIKSPGQATTRSVSAPEKSTTTPPPRSTTVKTSPPPKTSSNAKTTAPKKPVSTTASDPKSWRWPTKGRVVSNFDAGNPARNGLNIAGKEGQAITAAAAGQVVYSGNGLIGYGELIIVKHSEKMLSAYAHNKVRLVKEGDQVTSGQKIAEMGRNSSGDQILHFEIRASGKPVNPKTYLPAK
jgi:lipoprotein NlpD